MKHQLKEIEQQAKANLIGKQVVSEKDELIQRMKQQIKDHEGHSKVSEVKIIEAGRRIDQLIDQNNEYQKVCPGPTGVDPGISECNWSYQLNSYLDMPSSQTDT